MRRVLVGGRADPEQDSDDTHDSEQLGERYALLRGLDGCAVPKVPEDGLRGRPTDGGPAPLERYGNVMQVTVANSLNDPGTVRAVTRELGRTSWLQ